MAVYRTNRPFLAKSDLHELLACPLPRRWTTFPPLIVHLLCAVIALANVPAAILSYWMFLDTKPVITRAVLVSSTLSADASTLRIKLYLVKRRVCPGVVHHKITSDTGAILPLPNFEPVRGITDGEIESIRHLPALPPGDYVYTQHIEYWCNPLQRLRPLTHDLPPVHFTIPAH